MKTALLGGLVGLAISFALPTYAQQKDLADPQTTQKLLAGLKTDEEARNNNDPAAYAAQYTRDGVYIGEQGPVIGRQAIQKYFTEVWKWWHPKNCISKVDSNAYHLISTAGNELWATGEWSETGQDKNGEPLPIKGYWFCIYLREADDWKIRVCCSNVTSDSIIRIRQIFAPQSATTPSPTASPRGQ
jgi:ketosteroid isomerase-like protein